MSYRCRGGAARIRYDIGTSAFAMAAAAAVAAWMSQGAKQAPCQVARELGSQAMSEVLIPWVLGPWESSAGIGGMRLWRNKYITHINRVNTCRIDVHWDMCNKKQ